MIKKSNLLAMAAAVCALTPGTAGATGVGWGAHQCVGTATWQVSPTGGTATATVGLGTCEQADATVDTSGDHSAGVSSAAYGNAVQSFRFTPVVNTTAPAGAFSGTVTYSGSGVSATGVISGVNGGAFEAKVVWTMGTDVSVQVFTGAVSCGNYCFSTTAAWFVDPLRSV